MIKKILLSSLILLHAAAAWSNFPPTTTKGSADSTPVVTFQIATPNIPITHNGTVATFGTIPVAGGGTSLGTLTLNNVILGNGTAAPQFVAPGTSGNVLTSNGTTWSSSAAPAGADGKGQCDRVVGSAAQVTAGTATDSVIATSITNATAGDLICVRSGSWTENLSISKLLTIRCSGRGSVITGTFIFAAGSQYSTLEDCKFTGAITVNAGVVNTLVDHIWSTQASAAAAWVDNSGVGSNYAGVIMLE